MINWRILVGLFVLLFPVTAHAAPKDDARRYFIAGLEAAQGGEYSVALEAFLRAQELYPHPASLYNIARAYNDLGDIETALRYFRLYRAAAPETQEDIDPVIAVLEAKLRLDGDAADSSVSSVSSAALDEQVLSRLLALSEELLTLSERLEDTSGRTRGASGRPGRGVRPGEASAPGDEASQPAFLTDAYEQIVVSAARYGQDPLDSPSTVAVMTAEDIHMLGATRLSEVLRRVAGVDLFEAAVGKPEINIRGFVDEMANKVLVLIDGRPTYEDTLGTPFEESFPVTLEEVERIEIIRGPGSAVYGANAVTGVINIITRTPGEGKHIVRLDTGSQASPLNVGGYTRGSALATGRMGTTSYRLSAGYREAGSWEKDFYDGEFSSLDTYKDDQDMGLRSLRFNGRIDQAFGDGEGLMSVSGGYADADMEFLNQGVLNYFGANYRHRYLRGDLSYGPVHLRTFWNRSLVSFAPWDSYEGAAFSLEAMSNLDTADIEAESNHTFETGLITHRINGGVGYRFKQNANFAFFGPELPTYQENHYRAFLQDEMTLDRNKLLLSFRYDLDPNIDPAKTFSPRVSYIRRLAEKTSLRANTGTAFRAPNMVENYLYFALPSGIDAVGVRYGDQDDIQLDPERILSGEIGLHDRSSLYHEADIAVYVNRVSNRLDLSDPSLQVSPYDEDFGGYIGGTGNYVNRDRIYIGYGVEADLSLYPREGLDVFVNATLQQQLRQFEEHDNDFRLDSDRSHSAVKVNGGVAFRTKYRTDISTDIGYASAQRWLVAVTNASGTFEDVSFPLPYRLQWNARVAARPTQDEKLELALIGWNMLGFVRPVAEHGEGQPISGRLLGSVRYSF